MVHFMDTEIPNYLEYYDENRTFEAARERMLNAFRKSDTPLEVPHLEPEVVCLGLQEAIAKDVQCALHPKRSGEGFSVQSLIMFGLRTEEKLHDIQIHIPGRFKEALTAAQRISMIRGAYALQQEMLLMMITKALEDGEDDPLALQDELGRLQDRYAAKVEKWGAKGLILA